MRRFGFFGREAGGTRIREDKRRIKGSSATTIRRIVGSGKVFFRRPAKKLPDLRREPGKIRGDVYTVWCTRYLWAEIHSESKATYKPKEMNSSRRKVVCVVLRMKNLEFTSGEGTV